MKSILILGATLLVLVYVILFFVDHQLWPETTGLKIRNGLMILFALYLCYDISRIYFQKKEKEENALVYRVAATGKKVSMRAYEHIRPFQKEFLTWLAIAVGLAFVGMVLMGIPGYLFLEIPVWLGLADRIEGDNTWPAAIYMSMFWPFFLPAGVLVKHALIRNGYISWALTGWIGTVAAGIALLVTMTYWMFNKK